MPEIISFDDALAQTKDKDRSLLIGNGFSIEHFSYQTLLEKAGLDDEDPVRKLFAELRTFDFESVIRARSCQLVIDQQVEPIVICKGAKQAKSAIRMVGQGRGHGSFRNGTNLRRCRFLRPCSCRRRDR
jgi:hypothetical protein